MRVRTQGLEDIWLRGPMEGASAGIPDGKVAAWAVE